MRKSIPLKTLQKLIAASVFPIVLISLSTPCFANHHKKVLLAAPVEAPAPESSVPDGAIFLVLLLGGLGAWIYFLRADRDSIKASKLDEIHELKDTLAKERAASESRERHGERLQSDYDAILRAIHKAHKEIEERKKEQEKLNTRLENIRLLDPEIDKKASELAEARAKRAAEKKENEEALALQMKVKTQGQAQLDQLLSDMRRGY